MGKEGQETGGQPRTRSEGEDAVSINRAPRRAQHCRRGLGGAGPTCACACVGSGCGAVQRRQRGHAEQVLFVAAVAGTAGASTSPFPTALSSSRRRIGGSSGGSSAEKRQLTVARCGGAVNSRQVHVEHLM